MFPVNDDEIFIFTIPDFTDNAPTVSSNLILYRSGQAAGTLSVPNPGDYLSIKWYFDNTLLGESANLVLDVSDLVNLKPYNILGPQTISVEVINTDGKFYSKNITFTVKE
jgi:hypothetical protein